MVATHKPYPKYILWDIGTAISEQCNSTNGHTPATASAAGSGVKAQ
jgi:hypothetical protein